MYAKLVAAALLASGAAAQSFTINTPTSPVECEPLQLAWSGGTAPYYISILPGGQPTAAALINFGQQSGNTITWTVNFTAGTSLGLTARDSTGATAQSASFTVQPGSDSCLSSSASSGSSSTSGGSSSTGATTAPTSSTGTTTSSSSAGAAGTTSVAQTTGTTSNAAQTTGTSGSSSRASSSSSASSSTTSASSSAAKTQAITFSAVGLVGAAILAALA